MSKICNYPERSANNKRFTSNWALNDPGPLRELINSLPLSQIKKVTVETFGINFKREFRYFSLPDKNLLNIGAYIKRNIKKSKTFIPNYLQERSFNFIIKYEWKMTRTSRYLKIDCKYDRCTIATFLKNYMSNHYRIDLMSYLPRAKI